MPYPSLAASGSLAFPEYAVYRMLLAAPTYLAEFADIDAAAASVGFQDVDFATPRPCAVINTPNHEYRTVAGGAQYFNRAGGTVTLYLAIDADGEGPQAELTAKSFFGKVLDEIMGVSGADQTDDTDNPSSHLNLLSANLMGYTRTPRKERGSKGDFYFALYRLTWGD